MTAFISRKRLTGVIAISMAFLVAGCATTAIKSKYKGLRKDEEIRHKAELARIQNDLEGKLVDPSSISLYIELNRKIDSCGESVQCIKETNENFIKLLRETYSEADFGELFALCHNTCETPRQLEFLAALKHNASLHKEIERLKSQEEQKHQNILQNLNKEFRREYALAKERDRLTAMAFAAGLQAAGESMQRQAAYQRSMGYGYSYYPITPSYGTYNRGIYTSSSFMGSGMTFYSGDISGSSQRIGPFTYYNFDSGVSGSSQDIGNFTYYNFNAGLSGTSQRIGNFTYHNFNSGTFGTTQSIGNFDYTNFSDGTHCSTQYIGNTAYTNCY
jgi:hypothetical protein